MIWYSIKKNVIISAMSVLIILPGCKVQQSAQTLKALPAFDAEGHRGARGLMPENTIPAMIKAIDLGVSTIEMDVHVTSDKQVILSHDNHINHLFTLTPEGKEISKEEAEHLAFYQLSYSTIRAYDVGSKYYDKFPQQEKMKVHIPLLSDLINSVENHIKEKGKAEVFYNIETKSKASGDNKFHPDPEMFVKLLMEVIESKKITSRVIIQSFDPRTLRVLHEKYPHVRTSYLVESNTLDNNLKELGFTPAIYSPNAKLVTAELVSAARVKNLKVIPWTVNTREEIDRLKALGVDGIISDYPNLFNQ